MTKNFPILLVSVLLATTNASGQQSNLFQPLNEDQTERAISDNEYFVKRNTFDAKRFKIVRVRHELLIGADQFQIDFFDELSVRIAVRKVDSYYDARTIRLTGTVVQPAISVEDLIRFGLEPDEAKDVQSGLIDVEIYASDIYFDETTRTKFEHDQAEFKNARQPTRQIPRDVNATFDVSTDPANPFVRERYVLRPFPGEKDLHLLTEVDFSKHYKRAEPGETESPENREKRNNFEEYLDSIGPDPRAVGEKKDSES